MPGIYYFEDDTKKPLYIGKSINLRSRLRQHFENSHDSSQKASLYVAQSTTIYYQVVNSDIEAIILESALIKSHLPKYNALSKDDKTNCYIIFTNQPDPKIKITHTTDIRSLELDDIQSQVFGPYQSARTATTLLKICRRIFGFCQFGGQRNRPCFYHHLHQCPGVCSGDMSSTKYAIHLGKIKKFLGGEFTALLKEQKRRIKYHIKHEQYEQANLVKQTISQLTEALDGRHYHHLLELADNPVRSLDALVQSLNYYKLTSIPARMECYDLAHNQGQAYVGSMSVMHYGASDVSQYRHFKLDLDHSSDPQAMLEIITRRLRHTEWPKPDLIILDGGLPQLSVVSKQIDASIPIIALAKKRELIYFYDQDGELVQVALPFQNPGLSLIRRIRDEAHRFANSFHQRQIEAILTS